MSRRQWWKWTTAAVCACLLAGGLVAWGAYRVVNWAVELPDRIVLDVDGAAVQQWFVESMRASLRDGDAAAQTPILTGLADEIDRQPAAAAWVAETFGAEVRALQSSADPAVAAAASRLVERLPPSEPAILLGC